MASRHRYYIMKTLYKLSIFYTILMLAACAEEDTPEIGAPNVDYDSPRIVVFGGGYVPGVTRAGNDSFTEPSNYGTCNANKIRILQFRGTNTANNGISSGDLKSYNGFYINGNFTSQLDLDLENRLNYRDKCTSSSIMNISFSKGYYTGYAFPAIAYSDKDGNIFDFSIPGDEKYRDTTLKVNNAEETPELYFGRLRLVNNNINYSYSEKEGITNQYNGGTSNRYDCQLEGVLYRIVSQLNVNISDINPNVKNLEMYLSNVPIKIGLYADHRSSVSASGSDHGYYYPVMAASDTTDKTNPHHIMKPTKVCSVSEFKDGNARLSTFILPSKVGRTVTIKATLNKAYFDAEKNTTLYNDTVISRTLKAGKDYNLDLPTSKVYFSNKELPVYKEATSEFMSYSNVRVNVSGRFSDIFSN